jgi:hypothetical protein
MDMMSRCYVYVHVCCCDRVGANRGKWITQKGMTRRGLWLFRSSKETPGTTRSTCRSGSSLAGCISIQIVVTLPDMSGRLSVAVIS